MNAMESLEQQWTWPAQARSVRAATGGAGGKAAVPGGGGLDSLSFLPSSSIAADVGVSRDHRCDGRRRPRRWRRRKQRCGRSEEIFVVVVVVVVLE